MSLTARTAVGRAPSDDGVVIERKAVVEERPAVAAKAATAHPEIAVELLRRRVKCQDENLAMPAFEEKIRGRICPALVVDVDRRRRLGIAVDDHERHAPLA
jgi:hypothetical protein